MSTKMKTLGVPVGQKQTLAVSDGELNMAESGVRRSSNSLNGEPGGRSGSSGVGVVASWAVSFERLLEDPMGVHYFTAFLKSEVSAENILFWQACEKFRQIPASQREELTQEARAIYDDYISNCASHAVNIDDTARIEESHLQDPKPDMFKKAQQQIFKLMKFDSYTRFVRSQLYQNCMLANVEGRPLPDLTSGFRNPGSVKSMGSESPLLGENKKLKKKVKPGKLLPVDLEDGVDGMKGTPESKLLRDKLREKRGSWGEPSDNSTAVSRRESQCSVKSANSLELGPVCNRRENESSCPQAQEPEQVGAGRAEKYCCVYLPDGTASLAPARPGLPIRDMLAGMCEKRGLLLNDIVIYLHGKDKQRLSLDQDSSVLRDQQVTLELWVKFALEIAFTERTVGMKVKSSKTLQEALANVMQKHNLRVQDAVVTMSGCKEPLNMSMAVISLANMRVQLDRLNGPDQASTTKVRVRAPTQQGRPAGMVETEQPLPPLADRIRTNSKARNPALRKTYDMDGLIDLLSRAPSQVDDQRGLLRKEHLVIPTFLQLPQEEDGEGEEQVHFRNHLSTCLDFGAGVNVTAPTSASLPLSEARKPPGCPTDPEPSGPDARNGVHVPQSAHPIAHSDSGRETTV